MKKRKEPVQDDVSWNMKHSDGSRDTCEVTLTSTVRD